MCVCSLADTYSDGLGNLDFERSQLGAGMSQRSAAKRLVNALHAHAQRTNQKQFDLQTIRSVADRLNIKVRLKYTVKSAGGQIHKGLNSAQKLVKKYFLTC